MDGDGQSVDTGPSAHLPLAVDDELTPTDHTPVLPIALLRAAVADLRAPSRKGKREVPRGRDDHAAPGVDEAYRRSPSTRKSGPLSNWST